MSETQLQKAILQLLHIKYSHKAVFFRNNTGAVKSGKSYIKYGLGVGSADIIGCLGGRFIALEVKLPKGRQSPDQMKWQGAIEHCGGFYAIVRSPEEAMRVIEEMIDEDK